jgi:hypothetical protein
MDVPTLRSRFEEELDAIDAYVALLQQRAFGSAQEVIRLVRLLDEVTITVEAPSVKLVQESFTTEELRAVHLYLRAVRPEIESAFREAEADLLSTYHPIELDKVDVRSFEGELIQYVMDEIDNESDVDFEKVAERLHDQLLLDAQRFEDELGENYPYHNRSELVEFVIRSAIYIRASSKAHGLLGALETIDELEANLRLISRETPVNVFRQGFILLMTIFDATVFDLMRLALEKNFFELIGVLAKQDRLSFDRFTQHSSFESLRDEIIEEKLKPKYLKDLLFIIQNKGVALDSPPYSFGHVVELVLRRNIHVHNRGFVDERYLERNDQGASMFNFDNYKIGEFADIDKEYWERARDICRACIDKICTWVEILH